MKLLSLSLLFSLGLLLPSYADLAQKTAQGYTVGDKTWPSWKALQDASNAGDAYATYTLAWAYDEGKGVKEDDAKANELYKKAMTELIKQAKKGELTAILLLADSYDEGNGVSKDKKLAIQWYEKAAEKGSAYALHQLGEFYKDGKGVPKDPTKAKELFQQAKEKGYVDR